MQEEILDLSLEERTRLIEEIQAFVWEELDQEIGSVKADRFIEFVKETVGRKIYNKGISDSKEFMMKRIEDLGIDMDQLFIR